MAIEAPLSPEAMAKLANPRTASTIRRLTHGYSPVTRMMMYRFKLPLNEYWTVAIGLGTLGFGVSN